MNRICIYMTHNTTNKLKAHVRLFLESMVKYADVYVVCNFTEKISDDEILNALKGVFYRKNIGWDAGAYKDAICEYVGWEEIRKYDELIIANDSFYGPLYDWKDSFDIFENDDCDYWGMTGQIAGNFENPYYEFLKHVHSYFLAFKKQIILSEEFKNYWEKLKYPVTFRDALVDFEISINKCLTEAGFVGQCYTDYYDIPMEKNEILPYIKPLELVEKYKLPIIKRKALLIRNKGFVNAYNAVSYIENSCSYPVDILKEIVDGQFNSGQDNLFGFIAKYQRIYIYGHGVCGKNLAYYFKLKNISFDSFVVSQKGDEDGDNIIVSSDMMNDEKVGVIISVINEEAANSIKQQLLRHFKEEQLFLLADCPAIRIPN